MRTRDVRPSGRPQEQSRYEHGTTGAGSPISHRFARDGDYTVTLTVSAEGGRSNTATQVVHVRTPDMTPPDITVPENMSVPATSPTGATVFYEASATDAVDGPVPVACAPRSGSPFPIGTTTTVTCTASDTNGNRSTAGFSVHVKDAGEQLVDLTTAVRGIGPGTSLIDKMSNAEAALANGDPAGASEILNAFIKQVAALANKSVPVATAERLIANASRIRTVLGH